MARVSKLEEHASRVARTLEDLSEVRDRVRRAETDLLNLRNELSKVQTLFEEARESLFEAFPELRPGGPGAYAVGGQRLDVQSPTTDPQVIEVDGDTPPDPLGRGGDPDDVDSDEVSFVEH